MSPARHLFFTPFALRGRGVTGEHYGLRNPSADTPTNIYFFIAGAR